MKNSCTMHLPNQVLHQLVWKKILQPLFSKTYNNLQWNPGFLEPPRETKIGSKNWRVWEIRGNIAVFNCRREMTFGSSYREVWRNDGSRNQDSTVLAYAFLDLTCSHLIFIFSCGWCWSCLSFQFVLFFRVCCDWLWLSLRCQNELKMALYPYLREYVHGIYLHVDY